MLPHLAPLSNEAPAGGTPVPPPPHFRPIIGDIRDVVFSPQNYVRQRGDTAAREAGLRFEAKAQEVLQTAFKTYFPTPRIAFVDRSGYRVCIPDGVVVEDGGGIVFEIKIQHTPNAWWQLRRLYQPVLEKHLFRPVRVVEVVRTFDPDTMFPEKFDLLTSIDDVRQIPPDRFGVLTWKL